MRRVLLLLALTGLSPLAAAETAYITDQLYITLREGQANDTAAIKTVVAGTRLEVLQRLAGFALVKEPQGAEGWVAERYLTADAPARNRLDSVSAELKQVQADASALRNQLAAAQKALVDEQQKGRALDARLREAAAGATAIAPAAAPTPETVAEPAPQRRGFFSLPWAAISFAMLLAGFGLGVLWLRERTRRKLGGMHIRVG
jgi:SH3 domain protein